MLETRVLHEPWKLPAAERAALDYPEPVVQLSEGLARFRHARGGDHQAAPREDRRWDEQPP
ncbi:hypothetical protein [Streptomyces sp. NPDC049915]|uniref:hypothetical protein n=1 Tax=Streptomyces sp. NPDC049915 TaxID=3155510 RepID=UPI00343E326F